MLRPSVRLIRVLLFGRESRGRVFSSMLFGEVWRRRIYSFLSYLFLSTVVFFCNCNNSVRCTARS